MWKFGCILILILSTTTISNAQTLHAIYDVQRTIILQSGRSNSQSQILKYEGHFYNSKEKFIYFQKPLYLSEFPDGQITINQNNNYYSYGLSMDTLQHLFSNNTDSMLLRAKMDMSSKSAQTYITKKFEWGVFQWKLLPETRIIQGLKCQRALQFALADSVNPAWDIWFCVNIPVRFGPYNLRDTPGLVVEAVNPPLNETYTLLSYNTTFPIGKEIFWPEEFSTAKFVDTGVMRKNGGVRPQSKEEKRAELIQQ